MRFGSLRKFVWPWLGEYNSDEVFIKTGNQPRSDFSRELRTFSHVYRAGVYFASIAAFEAFRNFGGQLLIDVLLPHFVHCGPGPWLSARIEAARSCPFAGSRPGGVLRLRAIALETASQ